MKATRFKDEAEKLALSTETVRSTFKKKLGSGEILGVMSPDKSEIVCFDKDEIDTLSSELCGVVSLTVLAQQLKLTDHQAYMVLQYLLKMKLIEGELTYNTFISKTTFQQLTHQKAKARKRSHRREMRSKQ